MKTLSITITVIVMITFNCFSQENSGSAYDNVKKVSDSLSWTWKNGKQGMIDKTGKELVPNIYDDISNFKNGFAFTFKKGKQGMIDLTGKIIIPNVFDDIASFKDSVAFTTKRGKTGLIGKSGKVILPNLYDDIVDMKDGTYRVSEHGIERIISKDEVKQLSADEEIRMANREKYNSDLAKAKADIKKAKAEIKKAKNEIMKARKEVMKSSIRTDNDNNSNVSIGEGQIHIKNSDGEVVINKDSLWVAENQGSDSDTTKIIFKKGKILFVKDKKDNEDINVDIDVDIDDNGDDDDEDYHGIYHDSKFHGNLSGFEFGMNSFMNNKQKLELPVDGKLLDLNTGYSWQVGLNFMHKSIGFNSKNIGMVVGLGFAFNNYRFDQQVMFLNDSNPIKFQLDTINKMKKNKLFIAYLTLPILFEFQVPVDHAKLHFAVGVLGSIKIASRQKQIFENNEKFVRSKDFHLNPFKCEATARLGYGAFTVFANYSLTTLFEKNKGPELYPVTVGMGLTF